MDPENIVAKNQDIQNIQQQQVEHTKRIRQIEEIIESMNGTSTPTSLHRRKPSVRSIIIPTQSRTTITFPTCLQHN
jgi:hypothetical protein